MKLLSNILETQQWCINCKKNGQKIGLVPTMGYLHEGHLTLVREARKACDAVIVSIFVNPMQFGVGEDFEEYPRNLQRDSELLQKEGVDAIFAPQAGDMYPAGYNTFVEVYGEITKKMCGASRPGHFKGVTTVVSKLFNICQPDVAYFGQKDAQQVMIIEKMVRELNFPVTSVRVPIVREPDGLALSSRNVYLNNEQRKYALILNKSLQAAKQEIENGQRDAEVIKQKIKANIEECPQADIDYIEISDACNLKGIELIKGQVLIALAVKIGNTRLIDNLLLEVD